MKSDDKDAIEAKTKDLTDASGKMAERLYAQGQPRSSAQLQHADGGDQEQGSMRKKGDNVVDAEFEEVKDDKDKHDS